jgi:hypothetical protein
MHCIGPKSQLIREELMKIRIQLLAHIANHDDVTTIEEILVSAIGQHVTLPDPSSLSLQLEILSPFLSATSGHIHFVMLHRWSNLR